MIEDPENTPEVCNRLSTTYGVNRRSVLSNIKYFDVCKCFPEDVMHILLEGVVPYETKLLLKFLIDEQKCLTLKDLNSRLQAFDYGHMNKKNKPSPLGRDTINWEVYTKLQVGDVQRLVLEYLSDGHVKYQWYVSLGW